MNEWTRKSSWFKLKEVRVRDGATTVAVARRRQLGYLQLQTLGRGVGIRHRPPKTEEGLTVE